ncbi:MAG: hypothetical protein ABR590_09450 [Spirochaetia bacterium]
MISFHAMQEPLRDNERRLRMSQEYRRVGTFDWDIRTGDVFWSKKAAAQRGLEAGFSAYITKPIDVKYLLETLNELISMKAPSMGESQ